MKKFAALLILLSSSVLAQTQFVMRTDRAQQVVSGYVKPIPGAAIRVCQYNPILACATPVTIYSDPNGVNPIAQPLSADNNGWYQYFVPNGASYVEQVSAPGYGTKSYAVVPGMGAVSSSNLTDGASLVKTTGSYTDPVWLTLNWSKILNSPTTLLGYGITDAASLNSFNAHVSASSTHGANGAIVGRGDLSSGTLPASFSTVTSDTTLIAPSSLSAAIAGAPAGGTVTATGRTSGTIESTIVIDKSLHLVLDGVALTVSANPGFKVTGSNVHVECKNNASITLSGLNASFLSPEGTVENLTVEGCRVKGSGNDADYHAGISNTSGQNLTNIRYLRNTISDVSLGIDINANLSGSINGFEISGNRLYNIVGTAPGHGYGIHHANGSGSPSSGVIANNYIERAGRHSIYQARGSGVTITGNVIRDHRLNLDDTTGKPAIIVSRSHDIAVSSNAIIHPTSGGIAVDTDSGVVAGNVLVQGNVIRDSVGYYPLWVGTPNPATDGITTDVTISGNSIYQDASVDDSFGAVLVEIFSGKRITFQGNNLVLTNSEAHSYVAFDIRGSGETAGTATYSDQLRFAGNTIYGTGSGDIYGFGFDVLAATSAITATYQGNRVLTSANAFYFGATQTNPNISVSDNQTSGLDLAKVMVGQPVNTRFLEVRPSGGDAAQKIIGASPAVQGIVSGGTRYNWQWGNQINVTDCFEVTPSTVPGGSVFTTPGILVCPTAIKIPALACPAGQSAPLSIDSGGNIVKGTCI